MQPPFDKMPQKIRKTAAGTAGSIPPDHIFKFQFIELFDGMETIDLTVDAMLRIAGNGLPHPVCALGSQ